MPSALITIARTGAAAARAGLDLTAQNIANASNTDYTRRTLSQSELVGRASLGSSSGDLLSGVTIGEIQRADSELLQLQVRTSTSDLARADAEISGLRRVESALEQSRVFETLSDFEAALLRLESDPLDPTLRIIALEGARQLSDTFQLADRTLDNSISFSQAEVIAGVETTNGIAQELARINVDIIASQEGSVAKSALLDARDAALRELSGQLGIVTRFDSFGAVEVSLGDAATPLVSLGQAQTIAASIGADGTASFALDGDTFAPQSGALAGQAAALGQAVQSRGRLDAIARQVIEAANTAQASGAAGDGSAGQPFFSGAGAGDMAVALNNGMEIATAFAGSPAGSRNTANLGSLIASIRADDGPIAGTDGLLLALSSRIAGLDTRREGLAIVASGAETALARRVGVDLDTEAANLVRLQQAFQANSRVIQVATEVFDTILGLR